MGLPRAFRPGLFRMSIRICRESRQQPRRPSDEIVKDGREVPGVPPPVLPGALRLRGQRVSDPRIKQRVNPNRLPPVKDRRSSRPGHRSTGLRQTATLPHM